MSTDISEKQRTAEVLVYANVARAYQEAMQAQANSTRTTQERKEAAAAHVAVGLSTLPSNEQAKAEEIKAGREILERTYGKKADDVIAVLAGRNAAYELPKGFERTNDVDALVRKGQNIADDASRNGYLSRHNIQAAGPNGHYLEKTSDQEAQKEKLVNHLLSVKAAIDANADKNNISKEAATNLFQRVQKETFTRDDSNSKNKEFAEYNKNYMARMQREVSEAVAGRYSTQAQLVDRVRNKENETSTRNPENVNKANDFRTMKPEEAILKHPELINAYGVVKAAEVVAKDRFANPVEQQKFVSTMRENVANRLEQGNTIPAVKIKEQTTVREAEPALSR